MERVSDFCNSKKVNGLEKVRIEFAHRGGMDYSHTIDYLKRMMNQDKYRGGTYLKQGKLIWDVIDFSEIKHFKAKKKEGLQVADIVASSFFNALDSDMRDSGTIEFAKRLKPRMGRKPDSVSRGKIQDYGLKIMPSLKEIDITFSQKHFFTYFGYRFK
jgi:hypothetical protein